jgi:hypothetical protein
MIMIEMPRLGSPIFARISKITFMIMPISSATGPMIKVVLLVNNMGANIPP